MIEVEFRDGTRLVPEHVAALLEPYETTTMTYDEAIRKANNGLARRVVDDAANKIVSRHLERWG